MRGIDCCFLFEPPRQRGQCKVETRLVLRVADTLSLFFPEETFSDVGGSAGVGRARNPPPSLRPPTPPREVTKHEPDHKTRDDEDAHAHRFTCVCRT